MILIQQFPAAFAATLSIALHQIQRGLEYFEGTVITTLVQIIFRYIFSQLLFSTLAQTFSFTTKSLQSATKRIRPSSLSFSAHQSNLTYSLENSEALTEFIRPIDVGQSQSSTAGGRRD